MTNRHAFPKAGKSTLFGKRLLLVLALGLSALCSGCHTGVREYFANGLKVGPNYHTPAAPVADTWIDYQNRPDQQEMEVRWDWWRVFNDPKLEELILTANGQNLTLREAGFRIQESRELRAVAIGNILPQQQIATGGYSRQMLSLGTGITAGGGGGFPGITRYFSVWNLGTQLAWEIDFWGQFRRAVEVSNANLDASIENYDDVLQILIADVASTYVEIRTLEQRIVFAQANVSSQAGSLRLTENRHQGGVASRLDVAQAITNLGQTESTIPDLQRQLRQAENRLCVLLGVPPQDVRAMIEGPKGIPKAPPEVVLGVPAELLRRRPDVRRAEREIAAQSARIGIAESELYPAFTVTGNIRVQAQQFNDMFNPLSIGGAVGPTFSWNIFNYFRIRHAVYAEEARFMQEVTQYQNTVLNAQREAEDAIVAYLQAQQQAMYLQKATAGALESRDLVQTLYQGGRADFGRVYVAELVLSQQQDALAIAQGSIATNLVEVFRALGGGWQLRLEPLPPMPAPMIGPVEDVAPPAPGGQGAPMPNAAPNAAPNPVPAAIPSPNDAQPPPVSVDEKPADTPTPATNPPG
jgi:NodT family efflux transporter outer membrane factor (OMF) lipoprotein